MIFDDVAEIMNQDTERRLSEKIHLSRSKIARIKKGLPFMLDHETILALQRLGYEVKVEKIVPRKSHPI